MSLSYQRMNINKQTILKSFVDLMAKSRELSEMENNGNENKPFLLNRQQNETLNASSGTERDRVDNTSLIDVANEFVKREDIIKKIFGQFTNKRFEYEIR